MFDTLAFCQLLFALRTCCIAGSPVVEIQALQTQWLRISNKLDRSGFVNCILAQPALNDDRFSGRTCTAPFGIAHFSVLLCCCMACGSVCLSWHFELGSQLFILQRIVFYFARHRLAHLLCLQPQHGTQMERKVETLIIAITAWTNLRKPPQHGAPPPRYSH